MLFSDGTEELFFNIHQNNFIFDRQIDAINAIFGDINFTTHPQIQFKLSSPEGQVVLKDFSTVLSPKSGESSFTLTNMGYHYDNLM